jgi:hypothetical protein
MFPYQKWKKLSNKLHAQALTSRQKAPVSTGYSGEWDRTTGLDVKGEERIPVPTGRLYQVTYRIGNHSTH